MKMKPEHYAQLKSLIQQVATEERQIHGRDVRQNWDHYHRRGHTDMRFFWDHLWGIRPQQRREWFDDNGIYDYLDDRHITTALKRILGELR